MEGYLSGLSVYGQSDQRDVDHQCTGSRLIILHRQTSSRDSSHNNRTIFPGRVDFDGKEEGPYLRTSTS